MKPKSAWSGSSAACKCPGPRSLNLGRNVDVSDVKPYAPITIARKSAINWNKGTTVMVLDDPAGNAWIMKGFRARSEAAAHLRGIHGRRPRQFQEAAAGWKARVVTLAQDNLEVPEGGVATILADEFFNVYDKTGPGMSDFEEP